MAKRIDANQKEIVATFRKLGCSVFVTSEIGKGFPDIVLGFRGDNYLIEIKDGKKPLSQQKLTEQEQEFHREWDGNLCIIRSIEDAISFINDLS